MQISRAFRLPNMIIKLKYFIVKLCKNKSRKTAKVNYGKIVVVKSRLSQKRGMASHTVRCVANGRVIFESLLV